MWKWKRFGERALAAAQEKHAGFRCVFGLLGLSCYTLALNLFLVGNSIAAGGFAGIATVINFLVPVPVGAVMMCLNVPLFAVSWRVKGRGFTAVTIGVGLFYSALIDWSASFLPTLTSSLPLAVLGGGLLYGAGLACLMLAQVSVGGTDLLTRILLVLFPRRSVGQLSLLVDGCVVVLAAAVFGNAAAGVCALLTIALCSVTADGLLALCRRAAPRLCLLLPARSGTG